MTTKGSFFDHHTEPLGQRISTGLNKIGMALRNQAWRGAGERGLSPTQGQILTLLRARAPQRPSALAEALGVSLATVSDSVKALVEKGFVLKQRDADDARATGLVLTAPGRQEAENASSWPDFLATSVEVLSLHEQEVFFTGLVKMIRTLQERGQIPVARMCVTCKYFQPNRHAKSAQPHHCGLVDAAFGTPQLRLDCAEHEVADEALQQVSWTRFLKVMPAT